MEQTLSRFLRQQADQSTDRSIPAATLNQINAVAAAEREFKRHLGPVETAWRTLRAAYDELFIRHVELQVAIEAIRVGDNRRDGPMRELVATATAEVISASDWVEQCGVDYRKHVRQAQQDLRDRAS